MNKPSAPELARAPLSEERIADDVFRDMRRQLECEPGDIRLELRSRDGSLSESQQAELGRYLSE